MKKLIRKFYKSQDGVAATEFALISPVLVVMLIGVIDVGFYTNEKMKAESAARATVEYLLSSGEEENILEDVLSLFFQDRDESSNEDISWSNDLAVETGYVCECSDGEEISCTASCDSGDYRRRYVEATVTKNYHPFMAYPGLPSSMPVEGYARLQKD